MTIFVRRLRAVVAYCLGVDLPPRCVWPDCGRDVKIKAWFLCRQHYEWLMKAGPVIYGFVKWSDKKQ